MRAIYRVYQEHLHGQGAENGDCLRACIASIFRLPITEVPHFCRKGKEDEWYREYHAWLGERGWTALDIKYNEWVRWCFKDGYYLLSGPSPRFPEELHVVIAYGTEIVHDPHPDGSGILPANEHHGWLVTVLSPLRPGFMKEVH